MDPGPKAWAKRARAQTTPRAFTLIELMVVIGIIAILAALTVPAIRSMSKSNDQSQAANLVRAMVSNARAIAASQHRMAGVVFFEETPANVATPNPNQTAMQLVVEAFDQGQINANPPAGVTYFVYYSTQREYLPAGVKIAALNDNSVSSGMSTAETTTNGNSYKTRVLLFDANGMLMLRSGLATPTGGGTPYPKAYLDWNFLGSGVNQATSSPGLFIYNKAEYDAQGFNAAGNDSNRAKWLVQHATIIAVNSNTGGLLR